MNKNIRLSPKHGLNPSIPVCFWCGKEKNEIALLGKLPEDAEAPHKTIIDYEPCDECKAQWDKGIVFLGVQDTPLFPNQPAIQAKHYPTSHMMVLTEEGAKKFCKIQFHKINLIDENILADILKEGE